MPGNDPRLPTPNPDGSYTLPDTSLREAPQATGGTAPYHPGGVPLPSVPGFVLLGEIARGGMGVVYSARDTTLNRPVAVKTILPELAGRVEIVAQFVREAGITARLPHPGIPPVHAAGTLADGRPCLAMKLIAGKTLEHLMRERNPTAADLRVFEQIAQTLGFAHSQGIIHRDLKPANVMVGSFGEVQVMDWGIARSLANPERDIGVAATRSGASGTSETVHGTAKGTPAYMAPEQARGEWHRVDARADVFALGGILCATLTGKPPFTGLTTAEVIGKAAAGDLSEPCARLDACGADEELVALCKWCLAPEPTVRPENGEAVAKAVAAFRAGQEERVRRAERELAVAEGKTAEQQKRRRVQLALAAAVGLLLLGGGAFAWSSDRHAAAQREAAIRQQAEDDKRAAAERERTAKNSQAIELLLGQCEAALRKHDAGAAAIPLAEIERRTGEGGEAFRARVAQCRKELEMLRELDRIDGLIWTVVSDSFHSAEARKLWSPAFEAYGLVPGRTPEVEVVRKINESFIRERLIGVLDRWFVSNRSDWMLAVLTTVDADTYRDSVRLAIRGQSVVRLLELADKPAALDQPARFAIVLGERPHIPEARREAIMSAAAERSPGDWLLLMELGTLHSGPGANWQEMEKWYRAVLAVRPATAAAWNNIGATLGEKLLTERAIHCYREALRIDPKYARTHNNLGWALLRLGDVPGAKAAFEEARRLEPKWAEPLYALGMIQQRQRDLKGALASFQEAARLDPEDMGVQYKLGVALEELGELEPAAVCFRTVLKANPKDARAHTNLGNVYLQLQRYWEAIDEARAAIKHNPESPNAYGVLGTGLLVTGDREGARAAWEKAAQIDPKKFGHLLDILNQPLPKPVAPPPRLIGR